MSAVHDLTLTVIAQRITELEERIAACHCETDREALTRWRRRLADLIPRQGPPDA